MAQTETKPERRTPKPGPHALTDADRQQIINHLLRGDEPNSVELTRYKDGQYAWGVKLYFGARLPVSRLLEADAGLREAFLHVPGPNGNGDAENRPH